MPNVRPNQAELRSSYKNSQYEFFKSPLSNTFVQVNGVPEECEKYFLYIFKEFLKSKINIFNNYSNALSNLW